MVVAYKARENDIVESQQELEYSISNNLVVFFDVFLQKLAYELKLVTSIQTQDGSVVRAGMARVQDGNLKNGQPKFKNVYNKFAVLDVWLTLPGLTRKKLTRLVIAPVNIFKLNPKAEELEKLNALIGKLITIPSADAPTVPAPAPKEPVPEGINPLWWELNKLIGQSIEIVVAYGQYNYVRRRGVIMVENTNRPVPRLIADLATPTPLLGTTIDDKPVPTLEPPTVPVVTPPVEIPVPPVAPTLTLKEWYGALGQPIPLFYKRAEEYERLGLGPRGTYLGTAEQNIKFLAALKAEIEKVN